MNVSRVKEEGKKFIFIPIWKGESSCELAGEKEWKDEAK